MRFSDLCEKEVVNVKDCRCLGSVRDLDIDQGMWENSGTDRSRTGKISGLFLQGQRIFYSMG